MIEANYEVSVLKYQRMSSQETTKQEGGDQWINGQMKATSSVVIASDAFAGLTLFTLYFSLYFFPFIFDEFYTIRSCLDVVSNLNSFEGVRC